MIAPPNNLISKEMSYLQQTHARREYKKWWSPLLQRDMELLIFGYGGAPVILFPTRTARFYDYENWGMIDMLEEKLQNGAVQIFCLDSVDTESFYCKEISPAEKIARHILYEKYLLRELLPFVSSRNSNGKIVSAGCSLGAYHCVNLAFRHPGYFSKVIAMSGRYDLTVKLQHFDDLFDGFWNEEIYFNMPAQNIDNLTDETQIAALKKLQIIFSVGAEDSFLQSNIQLSSSLHKKDIYNILHLDEGEAHKTKYWGKILNQYL